MKGLLGDLHELVTCLGLSSEGGGGSVQLYSGILYQVVAEEDGCLVHTLQAASCAWKNTIGKLVNLFLIMYYCTIMYTYAYTFCSV